MTSTYRALTGVSIAAALLLSSCTTFAGANDTVIGRATISAASGEAVGTAVLAEGPDGAKLTVIVASLEPGAVHGIHLHTVGACQGPGFYSAGPHLNPFGRQHGVDNPAGSHLGDLPNLTANAAGAARFTVLLHGTSADLAAQLFDSDGTAIIIHADPDDLKTDPSGNSGKRIACGVVFRAAR